MTLTTFPANGVDTEAGVQAPARPAPAQDVSSRRSGRPRVLIVTDDPSSLRDATTAMTNAGMLCLPVESDAGAMRRAAQWEPDVALILGSMVPLDRRVQWLYALRNEGSPLVVMVFGESERLGGEEERLALEVGFDAVWAGLGAPTLLCSRLQALMRPRQRSVVRRIETGIALGDLTIDGDLPLARRRGRVVPLTSRQVRVLHAMATAPGRTLSRPALAAMNVNGDDEEGSNAPTDEEGHSRAVDVFISRLRRRLRQLDISSFDIVAVRTVGYRLIVTAED